MRAGPCSHLAGRGRVCGHVELFIVFSLGGDGQCDVMWWRRKAEEGGEEGSTGRRWWWWWKDGRLRLESEMKEDMKWKDAEEVEGRGNTWKQNEERLKKIVITGNETRDTLGHQDKNTTP